MEIISVFHFLDYKPYLVRAIQTAPRKGRGMKSALATAAGCQSAYFSRMLADQAELNLEQADAISQYLGHTEPENQYFLLCVQHTRAGTPRLRAHFRKQLEDIRQKRSVLKERFQVKQTLTLEDQTTYYSSWLHAAAHMAASVPQYGTKELLASLLGVSTARIAEILDFLQTRGMLIFDNGKYRLGTVRVHLGSDSPLISKHHTNWRIQVIRSLDREAGSQKNEDLHYSSIVSLSRADRQKLKALLLKTIDEFNAVVAPSPEEEVQCLALDFFQVGDL
jgi:uncharacterized protein (TIGR02147 family)